MRCANCQADNREGRKFCASCGANLPVSCADCGYANEEGERYCGGCGRPLSARAPAPPEPSRPVEVAADRRPVTVLFCDLVGYTTLSSKLDPEEVHAFLERYFTLVDGIVERFGGTIDKHIGDAAMALFGAPLAHGNDEERAVRAALEIQASVSGLSSGLPSAVAVHIGLATGEVVASSVGSQRHRTYTVTGEAANVAARLMGQAASGQTLASDAVYRATHHAAIFESAGSLILKGLNGPVEAWRLTGARTIAPDAQALVGRRSELAYFSSAVEACVGGASGAAVAIRGEPGIGKTRLMDQLQSIASAAGMARHAGFVLDFGAERGHGAVRKVIASLVGVEPDMSPAAVEGAIETARLAAHLTPDDALYLRDFLEAPQPEAARKLYEAMDAAARTQGKQRAATALVRASAERQPLLVAVEDIHWADAETLSLLAAIARASAVSRTILAMTTRLEGDPLDAQWRGAIGEDALVTFDLSPLSAADALSIARRFIDADAFADQCVERAGGNPLFLEQLLRGAGDLVDGQLPSSIQSVVLARTDLLAAADRRAIQAASVLGQRFTLSHLRALLDEPGYRCDALIRNVLLRSNADGLQFAHALVRDGVYSSLTHARKRELHRAAAAIFVDDPVLRAEHLDRGGDARAPRAYFAASRAQADLFRHDQAVALAARGLAIGAEKRDVVDLALLLGVLQQDVGRGAESLDAYRRALAASDDKADRCRALLGCAAANRLTARVEDAFNALADAEPLAVELADDRALAEAHYLRGNLHFARGDLTSCRREHTSALDAARRLASPEWQARALSGLADALYMDCRMATALHHFAECVDLCDAQGLARIAAPNRVMMGHCQIYTCAFDLALVDMRAAMETAARIGDRHGEMFALQSQALCMTAAGRYAEAAPFQRAGLEQARTLNARRYEVVILGQSAEVALCQGRRAEALELARAAQKLSEETGPGFAGPIALGLLALIEESREAKNAALAAGEALLAKGAVGHNHFSFRRYAIEGALLANNWSEVDRQANVLLARMQAEPLAYSTRIAERGRLLARRGRGEASAADEEKLSRLRTEAAAIDMRIDAMGEALRAL
jgi:class 3 adenylate cyclase